MGPASCGHKRCGTVRMPPDSDADLSLEKASNN